jgi:dihydroceramidase
MDAFWGPITSTIEWCEGNYMIVPWVAEFWNTVTSLIIALFGLVGWRLHRDHDLGMRLAFITLAVVGLGSVAFHGTLRFEAQMMDELPMMWGALCMFYNLATGLMPKRHHRRFATALIVWGVATTLAMILTRHTIEFQVFVTNFLLAESLGFAAAVPLYRRFINPNVRRWFWTGVGLHAFGGLCWITEQNQAVCDTLLQWTLNPQLHAVWHVFTGAGMYTLFVCTAAYRGLAEKKPTVIVRVAGVMPAARFLDPPTS